MKPAHTYREARVLQSAREVLEKSDIGRAKRTEPAEPIATQPLAEALKRWYGRVLKPTPTPAR
jgi:hypothetical protein